MWCLFFWEVPTWVRARSSGEGGGGSLVIWALGNHLQSFHLVKHQFGVPLSWSTSQRVEPKFQHLMSPTPGVVHGTSSLKLFRFQTDFYLIWKNSMGSLSPGPELHCVWNGYQFVGAVRLVLVRQACVCVWEWVAPSGGPEISWQSQCCAGKMSGWKAAECLSTILMVFIVSWL